ncbi:U-box domain-containing protein kinase family protein [Thalictrum thalictroides]|uniref:RING-type E3 ubiquitin transferase n=1 Tax=Thalictrum thalictroides TaxID=46969 RepID=A0A7J6UW84_THATH|nr:U-box domain-containing protein kinase family protein [Thalictrum thalictroides]
MNQTEKIYVAVSNNVQEGLTSLEWAINHWSTQPVSIVILHVDTTSKNFVHTPYGKMLSTSVNDDKVEGCRMLEQEKIDQQLIKYMASCGKVTAEVLKIEKSEEAMHTVIVGLITRLRITKLVMGIAFMKSSSGKSRSSSISGSFHIHKLKPDFCELFLICGGKLVYLREENDDGYVEDDQGVMVARLKERASFKGWFGKLFTDNASSSFSGNSRRDQNCHIGPSDQQESYRENIEKYLQFLTTLNLNDEDNEENCASTTNPSELAKLDYTDLISSSASDKTAAIKAKIEEAQKMVEEARKKAKANMDRRKKAECIISLCNEKGEELQCCLGKEISVQVNLKRDIDEAREKTHEVTSEIELNQNRLNTVLEVQSKLANKIRYSSSEKVHVEVELEKALAMKVDINNEIEKLREQKDVMLRRIEFCIERNVLASVTPTNSKDMNCMYREFTEKEIRDATDNFSECMKLKSSNEIASVYKGRLINIAVAVKLQTLYDHQELHAKMELLRNIRHPHLISTIGACFDPKCIVFEYMHNGSLKDIFLSHENTAAGRRLNRTLSWYTCIQITSQICSGLGFLHSAKPRPIVHGNLNSSNVLLDRNFVAKITDLRLIQYHNESQLRSDIRDVGYLMLLILTRRGDSEVADEVIKASEGGTIIEVLNVMATDWPLDLAQEFACIAMKCIAKWNWGLRISSVMSKLDELMRKAAERRCEMEIGVFGEKECCSDVPNIFLCPITQEVMNNPCVAEDGFSYELEAIQEWIDTGHKTSPMTNLTLKHTTLTPNHTLHSLINDWPLEQRIARLEDNVRSTELAELKNRTDEAISRLRDAARNDTGDDRACAFCQRRLQS